MFKNIGQYRLLDFLGKGQFGVVYYTKKDNDKREYATKTVNRSLITGEYARYFNMEVYILKQLNHENVIKLYDEIKGKKEIYLVFDFCNGGDIEKCISKYKRLKKGKPFPERVVQHLMKQIVSSIQYIHNKSIVHRDIKCENILLFFENEDDKRNLNLINATVKLTDFGFARFIKGRQMAESVVGSPLFMDPAILQQFAYNNQSGSFGYDFKADIWSLGTVFYEMLCGGDTPFLANTPQLLCEKIKLGNYSIPCDLNLSKQALSFLNCMLRFNPNERLDINLLAKHEFVQKKFEQFDKIDYQKLKIKTGTNKIIMNIKKSNYEILGNEKMYLNNKKDETLINSILQNEMIDMTVLVDPKNLDDSPLQGEVQNILEAPNSEDNNNNNNNYKKNKINAILPENMQEYEKKLKTKDNNFAMSNELKDFLIKSFDEMNFDSAYLENSLIPNLPNNDPLINNLSI